MKITTVRIENFRSIKSLFVELGETTVFIGPNNAGKTAILDAVRFALTRRWGQRGTGFTEYDIHLAEETHDPKTSPGVVIELRTEEAVPGEWPEALHQALDNIVQIDPVSGRGSITLLTSYAWSAAERGFQPAWEFLNAARQPLYGASARRLNLDHFWKYLPVFYLGALRDPGDEFSSRSQFWGRLLKAMEIPQSLEGRIQSILDILNRRLLGADQRLGEIAGTLSEATRVASRDHDGSANLRVVPLKSWDLLSKTEIVLQSDPGRPWLPLQRHGQGVQSLSVIFLFKAFVEHLLSAEYEVESTPVLALEEPETHLHPQAARTLWTHINALPGQKIIATHSPYFLQHVPFRDLRLVHFNDNGTEVCWLRNAFSAQIPYVAALDSIVERARGLLTFDHITQVMTVRGTLEQPMYRALLECYGTHPQRAVIEGSLRTLRDESLLYISDDELRRLETHARRIRGEIFFARRWLIVEGQAEYLIVRALSHVLDYDFDEYGVSLIDAQNNGSPATFAALARALKIPWIAVLDGDEAGRTYVQAISRRGFDDAIVRERCRTLPAGTLEEQLLVDGLEPDLRAILRDIGVTDAMTMDRLGLKGWLVENKILYSGALASQIVVNGDLARRMPEAFRNAIVALIGLS